MESFPLDHIGIAVADIEKAIADHQRDFGFTLEQREKLIPNKVELAFLRLENTRLEFITPLANDTSLARFLEKNGPGLHHLCYKVDDIAAELARLKKLGHQLIDEVPRPGPPGTLIGFLHPKGFQGVLTELVQYLK